MTFYLRRIAVLLAPFTGGGGDTYSPALDFSDDRNSQYFVMGWP